MNIETLRPIARSLLRTYQVKSSRSIDLATALMRGKACSWNDGEKICSEGNTAVNMFIILKGQVKVSRKSPTGEDKVLVVLEAPTMIGHMGIVDGSPRSATCTAQGKVGAIAFETTIFEQMLSTSSADCSSFRHLLLAAMSMQLSTANQKIRNLIDDIDVDKKLNRERELQSWRNNIEEEPKEEQQKPKAAKGKPKDRLLEIAGVLDGWSVTAEGIDKVEFYEDDDMKRTREAKERSRK